MRLAVLLWIVVVTSFFGTGATTAWAACAVSGEGAMVSVRPADRDAGHDGLPGEGDPEMGTSGEADSDQDPDDDRDEPAEAAREAGACAVDASRLAAGEISAESSISPRAGHRPTNDRPPRA